MEYLNVSSSFLRRQVNARSGAVKVDGKTVVVIAEAPDTWVVKRIASNLMIVFTYTLDLSNDGGRTWNVRQIEMSFSQKK